MPHSHFHAEQWFPLPLPVVFAFFANPANLPRLMPGWQQARIEELDLKSPGPPPEGSPSKLGTGAGTTMILSFRPLPLVPLRLNWHVLIPEFTWNDHFCDVQTAGPFAFWRHCHSVRAETRNGVDGTVVRDDVEYQFPGGPLAPLADRLGGRAQIASMFAFRQRVTEKLLSQSSIAG